jgi:hypothetical protein
MMNLILSPSSKMERIDFSLPPKWFMDLVLKGGDRGTNEFADVVTQSLDGADLNAMWREFQRSINILNADRDPLVNMMTFPVTDPTERVMVPIAEDFEEATEYGEPKGIRLGQPYVFGYDFKWYDLAIRYTWLFLYESTAEQIRALNAEALEADNRLVFTKVFKAIFNKTNSTAEINQQNINVYRFYNADGFVPPPYKGTTFAGSHTHYITSGAATMDAGDIDVLEDHLYHHGYRVNNGYRLVLMLNRQEGAVIRTFKAGLGSPVAKYDFIPSAGVGGGVILPQGTIVGRPGDTVRGQIGTYGPFIVVEEDYIPAGYVFAFATGGDRNIGNPVGLREHQRSELRGLRLVKGPDRDYPLTDSFYQHGLGAGIRHRGAGVLMQITAAGTYTTPPAYV